MRFFSVDLNVEVEVEVDVEVEVEVECDLDSEGMTPFQHHIDPNGGTCKEVDKKEGKEEGR